MVFVFVFFNYLVLVCVFFIYYSQALKKRSYLDAKTHGLRLLDLLSCELHGLRLHEYILHHFVILPLYSRPQGQDHPLLLLQNSLKHDNSVKYYK